MLQVVIRKYYISQLEFRAKKLTPTRKTYRAVLQVEMASRQPFSMTFCDSEKAFDGIG